MAPCCGLVKRPLPTEEECRKRRGRFHSVRGTYHGAIRINWATESLKTSVPKLKRLVGRVFEDQGNLRQRRAVPPARPVAPASGTKTVRFPEASCVIVRLYVFAVEDEAGRLQGDACGQAGQPDGEQTVYWRCLTCC